MIFRKPLSLLDGQLTNTHLSETMLTPHQAKYYAYELTKRCPSDSVEKFSATLLDAQVDLNPHQVEAALFAFKSPLSNGAILADEVGLGKTIEAGLVISQKWAERKRRILIITPANLRKQWSHGGNRRFILVQLPESTDESSEAAKAGYRTIADIGKERIRRVIGRIAGEAKELESKISETKLSLEVLQKSETELRASLPKELFGEAKPNKELEKITQNMEKQQELLEQFKEQLQRIRQRDLGFRVFRLGESNFKVWDGDLEREDLAVQLELALDYVHPERTEQDILFEILIKSGFPLTTPIERLTLAGKTVWSVADGSMLVCLERPLTQEVIRAIAAMQPPRVVVLDTGFMDNDPLKTNAVQVMRSHGVKDFRTV